MVDVEVIPGKIFWAPESSIYAGCEHYLSCVLGEESDEFLRGGNYAVPHYSQSSVGGAFGPLALDQTVRFCQLLERKLSVVGTVVLRVQAGDAAGRCNAAVLLGAYLLLHQAWTLEQVEMTLSAEAMLGFPCSWSGRPACGPPQPAMLHVRDCWAGLSMARRLEWIDSKVLQEDELIATLGMSMYRLMAQQFDAVWISPGEAMVASDPMSTIKDPCPGTCTKLIPEARAVNLASDPGDDVSELSTSSLGCVESAKAPSPQKLNCTTSPGHFLPTFGSQESSSTVEVVPPQHSDKQALVAESDTSNTLTPQRHPVRPQQEDTYSCHTLCKDYGATNVQVAADTLHRLPPTDFVTFCEERGIGLVVRVNRGDEEGLVENGGSYEGHQIQDCGLEHLDLPIADQYGGVPSVRVIRRFLTACEERSAQSRAVLVHCKGGFGRSMVLVCCLLMQRHDLPGRALLGWVRIARPGAITTPDQERFLCSLGGRADLNSRLQVDQNKACCVIT